MTIPSDPPKTSKEAIDNLTEMFRELCHVSIEPFANLGVSAAEAANAFIRLFETTPVEKWALRTHLKDGSPIEDADT